MKKILLAVAVCTALFSCSKVADGEFLVTGTVKGMKNGLAFLGKQSPMGMGVETIDTVKIVDGKFEMKGKITEPELHFIHIDKTTGKVPLIIEEGEIEVAIDKDSLTKSTLAGTYNNEEFQKFNQETTKIQKRILPKVLEFQKTNGMKAQEAQKAHDTVTLNTLQKQFELVQKEYTDYMFGYPKTHPKSFISVLITQSMFNNRNFKIKDIEATYNSLDESLKNTKPGKEIKENIDTVKKQAETKKALAMGNVAPDFKAKTPDGKLISLKESLGKVTLVDFWASWCQPCRMENPNVVKLYNEFHAKGLNIISVSLDDDATKWKDAIAKDKLTWTQISNLKGFEDPIAAQYGITQIPTTYLLDANGKIVDKDLRGDELKAKINELLASK